jgi:RNA polymerase sigma-70 factor (ECF subfamily)
MSPPLSTSELRRLVSRWQGGDRTALDDLLRRVHDRLRQLARQMLRDFGRVRRWADTDDVLQNALLRLTRALEQWQPASTRDFYQMAATQLRRELLDLARYHARRERAGLRPPGDEIPEQAEPDDSSGDLHLWCQFHEEVERLPAEQREVVELRFYHGWSVAEVAEFLEISERTVIRRWQAALWTLAGRCGMEDEKE